ncbi:RILP-like protein 1 isoform X2 [Dendronephthya gigantea]|nr:RILP-like protein 1 isoform X2 [Dendronephthya gigantea]
MEQIIETFGHNAVMELMPKVIQVLEQLEIAVGEREKSVLELEEMRMQNERLMTEVTREASQHRRLDEELYQFKNQSSREISELINTLEKLRDENQSLHAEEKAHRLEKKEEVQQLSSADLAIIEQMKSTIDNQRDEIRSKNSEIGSVKSDLEAMEEQVDRLANINETIRRNLALQKSRNSTLAQEKADLEADINVLKQKLSKNTNGAAIRLNNEFDKLEKNDEKLAAKTTNGGVSPGSKDPNRPRFTLKELQKVLKERNELKEQVITLQEDLAFYKKSSEDEVDAASLELNTSPEKSKEKHEHTKSGISKLFKFLWKDESKTPVKTDDYIAVPSPTI